MANLVSVNVVCPTHTIVPWSVVTVSSPSHKFCDLFQSLKAGVHPSVPTSRELCEAVIDTVAVGRDKQSLSIVGMAMNVMDVCQTFGNFIKFRVISENESLAPTGVDPVKNAFEIMMNSQRQLRKPRLPERIIEKNKKDKLFNDLITLLESKGLKWTEGEITSGKCFVATLTSVLGPTK